MLRRRKSRAKMGQLGAGSPTGGDGNGDFEDNVFEVDEGGGTGRTGRVGCRLLDEYRVALVVKYMGWVD